ncbi:MAG: UbiA family prenyltransferase [Candidatus Moranbacteria bacterium]|nr:UbiA family prenyltransferase [Candidatus Moranbacteria bacterium]
MNRFKKIVTSIDSFVEKIFALQINVTFLVGSFFGIITLRVFEERFLASTDVAILGTINGFLYNFFFFVILYLLLWFLLSLVLKIKPMQLSGVLLWSFWLVLLPPIFDMVKTGGSVYWSFYALDDLAGLWQEFYTFFGHLPSGIVYFGTKIIFILTIFLVGALVLAKTKSFFKALGSAFATYVTMFVLGTLPSWLTMVYYFFEGSKDVIKVTEIDAVQFFGSVHPIFGIESDSLKYAFTNNLNSAYFLLLLFLLGVVFIWESREKAGEMARNVRLPQIIYHAGLLVVGIGLGLFVYPQNLHLNVFSVGAVLIVLLSVWLAWLTSVVVNDLNDYKIDNISNSSRPLQKNIFTQKEYADLGKILFGLSLLGGLVIGLKFAMLLFIYQILAWLYSAKPYRLKRFPIIATFFSALASVVIIFTGFSLFSGDDNIKLFPWRITFLMLAALTLSLPIKDFKDVAGDKADGVWTIPVLFGMEMGKLIVASGIFISYMLSVFFLNEKRLFWWALLLGGIAFLIMTHKKTKPYQMMWLVLGITAIYAVVLVEIVFIK